MTRRILGLVALLTVAACKEGTVGPPPGSRTIALSARSEGVTGTALITKETAARSTVWVTLRGVTTGAVYGGFIRQGSCQNPGGVAATLNGFTASSNPTTVPTRSVPDSVLRAGFHLHYDRAGPPPASVVCGNLD